LALGLRAGRCHVESNGDDGDPSKQYRKLVRSREFPGHQVLIGGRATISDLRSI
jgi:hypothetical protein